MRLCTLLPIILLAACGIPDDEASSSSSASTDEASSSSSDSSSSSSSGEVESDSTSDTTGDGDTSEGSGGWGEGQSTGEPWCGSESCGPGEFCVALPQTGGEPWCVVECTEAASCLADTEECVTIGALSVCVPMTCDVLADCPAGSVECDAGLCY